LPSVIDDIYIYFVAVFV